MGIELLALAVGAFSLALTALRPDLLRRFFQPIPISHKIAIVGLPGAGKTSLITAIFEVIQKGMAKPGIRIHGAKTIALVNRYIARLSSGQLVGPTTENDIFVFRFSYERKRFLQSLIFDIEIADFPGEFSAKISNDEDRTDGEDIDDGVLTETLFNREFFSWIASSSEYLFVIDLSKVYASLHPGRELQDISARIRTSWQVIEDATSDRGLGSPRRRRVHIVFSKLDSLIPFLLEDKLKEFSLLTIDDQSGVNSELSSRLRPIREAIGSRGKIQDLSNAFVLERQVVTNFENLAKNDFDDLIQFFAARVDRLAVHFVSLTLKDKPDAKSRYGVADLVDGILP